MLIGNNLAKQKFLTGKCSNIELYEMPLILCSYCNCT